MRTFCYIPLDVHHGTLPEFPGLGQLVGNMKALVEEGKEVLVRTILLHHRRNGDGARPQAVVDRSKSTPGGNILTNLWVNHPRDCFCSIRCSNLPPAGSPDTARGMPGSSRNPASWYKPLRSIRSDRLMSLWCIRPATQSGWLLLGLPLLYIGPCWVEMPGSWGWDAHTKSGSEAQHAHTTSLHSSVPQCSSQWRHIRLDSGCAVRLEKCPDYIYNISSLYILYSISHTSSPRNHSHVLPEYLRHHCTLLAASLL